MNGKSAPTVSVLMSAYNSEPYLTHAIESILNQTFEDFEFIIVDDGSTDATPRILADFAQKDKRIRVITHENRGLTASLIEGVGLARGEFIARMDADDISLPTRLSKQVEYLRDNPDCVLVGTRVTMIDAQGWPLGILENPLTHDEIDSELLRGKGSTVCHPSVLIRSSALRQVGGYREQFSTCQDLDLFLRLAEVGRLTNLPEALVKWRQHPASINHTRYTTWLDMMQLALKDTMRRRGIKVDIESVLAPLRAQNKLNQPIDFHLVYARRASASLKYFPAAIKHLSLSIWQNGLDRRHLQCLKGIMYNAFSEVLRAIEKFGSNLKNNDEGIST